MSSETIDWEAIARYLAGESPADEQAAVRRWLADHPGEAKAVSTLDDLLDRVVLKPELVQGIDVETALAKVKSRRRGLVSSRRRPIAWMPLAAAAGLVVAAALWLSRPAKDAITETAIAARTVRAPVGRTDSLVLPDGSQAMLGPGSELTIAAGYGRNERRVTVRGEAFFTVAHDANVPFVVAANELEVRDVGTAFVVHSDAAGVRVAVTEGMVQLIVPRHDTTTLAAGDVASVSPTGHVAAQRGVGAGDDLAWTKGRLVFRDTPLSEVAEDLERWYGVHLDIRDSALRHRPLTTSFQGDSLRHVLDVIALTLGATVELHGDTAVVRGAR